MNEPSLSPGGNSDNISAFLSVRFSKCSLYATYDIHTYDTARIKTLQITESSWNHSENKTQTCLLHKSISNLQQTKEGR